MYTMHLYVVECNKEAPIFEQMLAMISWAPREHHKGTKNRNENLGKILASDCRLLTNESRPRSKHMRAGSTHTGIRCLAFVLSTTNAQKTEMKILAKSWQVIAGFYLTKADHEQNTCWQAAHTSIQI